MVMRGDVMIQKAIEAMHGDTRYRILKEVADAQKITPTDLIAKFKLTQPAVSRQIGFLRNAQLIKCEKHGRNLYYSINESGINAFMTRFRSEFIR
jgi:DNA-binding transcriptional ArsR family regulator